MDVVRVSALSPPDKMRSRWVRNLLEKALEGDLTPKIVPPHKLETFTVTLPSHISTRLQALASTRSESVPVTAAGLIEAALERGLIKEPTKEPCTEIPGASLVRPLLHNLLEQAASNEEKGKVVFAEAATGTGKGRMIASLAANAAKSRQNVIISAPLAVTWQLIEDLGRIEEAVSAGITLVLGRPNFVSPEAVMVWASESDHPELAKWVEDGGPPISTQSYEASRLIGKPIRWLLEDALSLAETLPVSAVMLDADANEDCEGEKMYQSLKGHGTSARIHLCSHFMLAAHIRQLQLQKSSDDDGIDTPKSSPLPHEIGTLIVDEAHLLESAFAAINSHSLHLQPLIRSVRENVKRGKKPLLGALEALRDFSINLCGQARDGEKTGRLDSIEGLKPILENLVSAIDGVALKNLDNGTRALLSVARYGSNAALSGFMTISVGCSPVLKYPRLTIGRANLEKALLALWDRVDGGVLVSATLYSDDNSAKLTRWKLAVPVARACYLPAVHPKWTFSPVSLHPLRVEPIPDSSPEWADEAAAAIRSITQNAAGGTLVLCTSYLDAELLAARIHPHLGSRLIVQSKSASASTCAAQYRALYRSGIKPVWIGLGAAWTGINLSDDLEETPAADMMLTDLVVTRLPLGANRTITHSRRVDIAGFGIVLQEASWQFRQGIGRLVRREGVGNRNLWVLDARLEGKNQWKGRQRFNRILARYRKVTQD